MLPCWIHAMMGFNKDVWKFSLKQHTKKSNMFPMKWHALLHNHLHVSQENSSIKHPMCKSEALTARASCSLSFFLSRSRWRNRACCSLFSCRITALACLTFSFSACKATASVLLFSCTPFRMVWVELAAGKNMAGMFIVCLWLNFIFISTSL